MSGATTRTAVYVSLVCAAGAALIWQLVLHDRQAWPDWPDLLFWSIACFAAYLADFEIVRFGKQAIRNSIGGAIACAIIILFSPLVATVVIALTSVSLAQLTGKVPWYKVLFNRAMMALCAGLAALGYQQFPHELAGSRLAGLIVAALGASAVFFLVNTLVLGGVIAASGGSRPLDALRQAGSPAYLVNYLVSSVVAVILTHLYVEFGPLVMALFAAPLGLEYYTLRQNVQLRQAHAAESELAQRNAELYDQAERRSQELGALNEAARVIGRSLDLDDVLRRIAALAWSVTGSSRAAVVLLDQGSPRVVENGPGASTDGAGELHVALARRSLEMGRPWGDTLSSAVVGAPVSQAGFALEECAAAPILLDSTPIGALIVYGVGGSHLDRRLDAVGRFADQAAIAIQNARLFREIGQVETLRELDRLKNEFISMVSHDLRNPLTAIIGWGELLRAREFAPDRVRAATEEIYRQALRMDQLVGELLEVARAESGRHALNLAPVEIGPLVGEAVARFAGGLHGCRVIAHLPEVVPLVWADMQAIRRVLDNLLSNAVKYSPDGGTVTVAAEVCCGASPCLALFVSDEGMGIPPEHASRVFDKFYRVPSSATGKIAGTGLGLYVCRLIVEAHGGTISVQSQPHLGSVFRLTLPLAPASQDEANAVEQAVTA